MAVLYFDSGNTDRSGNNSRILKQELGPLGLDLKVSGRAEDFFEEKGAINLILDEEFAGYVVCGNSPQLGDVLEAIALKQDPRTILLADKSSLEYHKERYHAGVDISDGYLQEHHLPSLRKALQQFTQG